MYPFIILVIQYYWTWLVSSIDWCIFFHDQYLDSPCPNETRNSAELAELSQESLAKARCEKTMTFLTKQRSGERKKTCDFMWFLCFNYVSTIFQLLGIYVGLQGFVFPWFFSSKAIGCAQWSTTMGVADSGGFSGCRTDRPDKTGPPDGDVAVSCCQLILSWLGFLTCFDLVLTNLIVGFASVVAPFFFTFLNPPRGSKCRSFRTK